MKNTIAVLVVIAAASGANAQVFDFANFKTRVATQDSAVAPATVDFYFAVQRLFGNMLDDASVGTVVATSPNTGDRTLMPLPGGFFVLSGPPNRATEDELDADLPSDTYTFSMSGGTLGEGQGDLEQPDQNYWSSIPHISNWESLQNAAADTELEVAYDTPELDSHTTDGGVFWAVYDLSNNSAVASGFSFFFEAAEFVIPASALTPGTPYEISLTFSARDISFSGQGALAAAQGIVAFDSVTQTMFSTAPACDPDVNQDGNADQGDVDYLVNVVAGGDNTTGIDPDFNHDGNVDQGDIDSLINVVAGGACP